MEMPERCICCGEIIPEGRQVCPSCESGRKIANESENCCASLDYEKEYDKAMRELEKAKCEANYLRDELRLKEEEMKWHYGFRSAVELIFGKGGCNG